MRYIFVHDQCINFWDERQRCSQCAIRRALWGDVSGRLFSQLFFSFFLFSVFIFFMEWLLESKIYLAKVVGSPKKTGRSFRSSLAAIFQFKVRPCWSRCGIAGDTLLHVVSECPNHLIDRTEKKIEGVERRKIYSGFFGGWENLKKN